jgi:hypothetical protein
MQEGTEGAALMRWASSHPLAVARVSVWSKPGRRFLDKLQSLGTDPESPGRQDERTAAWAGPISAWILANTRPGDSVAIGGVGYIAYVTDRPVIDMVGLNDSHIAHVPPRGPGVASKGDPAYVIARRPKVIFLIVSPACYHSGFDYNCLLARSDPLSKSYLELLRADPDYRLESETKPWGLDLESDLAIFTRKN